ncbi:MAG: hypothetical protein LBT79_02535 [Elusimicrobiota bacterium]|jgi:hypothetical protein|nr:hypothetical protein [Elusimicrobiota bacterium]
MKDKAIAIELPVWMSPNDYIFTQITGDDVKMYFKVWSKPGKYSDKYGLFRFSGLWSIRAQRHQKLRYYPNEEEHNYSSYYLLVPNSSWLEQLYMERSSFDKDWQKYDKREYIHYIVQNNDYYIELIASSITFEEVSCIDFPR